METVDYIVVGSGCTGAMAAQTLTERGCRVVMLDGGVTDSVYKDRIPDKDYLRIKREEKDQYEYFIGKDFEGIPFGNVKTGEHLTPPRKFMMKQVKEWMPLRSGNFFPLESLALGGLGNGWGLGCCMFSEGELKAAGLHPGQMNQAYEKVAERIGISGSRDDAQIYTAGTLRQLMPSIEMDSTGRNLFENYQKKKATLNRKGFFMGRPSLALLTKNDNVRKAYAYKDLDFYSDRDKSAYRPSYTVEALQKQSHFTYCGGVVVLRFEEKEDEVVVYARSVTDQEPLEFRCRKLVLAAGSLSTARIVLRSFKAYDVRLPVISNPYSYLPAIQPYLLGKDSDERKIGFAQLSLFYDPTFSNMDVAMGSIYSYRSLMAFHILKETPMGIKTGFEWMRMMMPAFTILGLFHTEKASARKYIELKKDSTQITGDFLHVHYETSEEENARIADNEYKFTSALRSMNCFVMKKINPGHGSGIHYAGTLPFSGNNERFRILPNGRLGETKQVYVADGSGFNYLPAKGLTFSLMANAHDVALRV